MLCKFCGAEAVSTCTASVRRTRAIYPREIQPGDRFPLWEQTGRPSIVQSVSHTREPWTVERKATEPITLVTTSTGRQYRIGSPDLMIAVKRREVCGVTVCESHMQDRGETCIRCADHWAETETWHTSKPHRRRSSPSVDTKAVRSR